MLNYDSLLQNSLKWWWNNFILNHSPSKVSPNSDIVWKWIHSGYSEKHRYFYNLDYLNICLSEFMYVSKNLTEEEKFIVEFALWFHKIVYNTRTLSINEEIPIKISDNISYAPTQQHLEQSTFFASNACGLLNVTNAFSKSMIEDMIKQTGFINFSPNLFSDITNSFLGHSLNSYKKYEKNIQKEYEWLGPKGCIFYRVKQLQSLLDLPNIFKTPIMQEKYEKYARSNITWALEELKY